MTTVFNPPGTPVDLSGKNMNTVSNAIPAHVIVSSSAANADHVSDDATVSTVVIAESTGGWDAYEVWRRFIKDARDRRQHQE